MDGDRKNDGLVALETVINHISRLEQSASGNAIGHGIDSSACTVTPLQGGLTNDTVCIGLPAESERFAQQSDEIEKEDTVRLVKNKVVARRFKSLLSESLHYDRQCEYDNTLAAAQAQVAPHVLGYIPPDRQAGGRHGGALLLGYVDGRPFDQYDLKRYCAASHHGVGNGGMQSLVEVLYRLHYRCRAFANTFFPPEARIQYEKQVANLTNGKGVQWSGYRDVVSQLEPLQDRLAALNEVFVPCHNDLLSTNFIAQKRLAKRNIEKSEKLVLIDFELSGMAAASWELGNLASENELDDEAIAQLTLTYWTKVKRWKMAEKAEEEKNYDDFTSLPLESSNVQPTWLASRVARVHAWSLISKITWAAWGNVMHILSSQAADSPSFDFAAWSQDRIRRAQHVINILQKEEALQALIDNLQSDELDQL